MRDISPGQVFLVGAGPGDPELLTLKAAALIRAADVVVHDGRTTGQILALIPDGVRRVDAGGRGALGAMLADLARDGLMVVWLVVGDPMLSGPASNEAMALRAAGIAVACVPGIAVAQGAAASAGVPLTRSGPVAEVLLLAVWGEDGAQSEGGRTAEAAGTTVAVETDAAGIAAAAARLMRQGHSAALPVLAVAAPATPREARILSTLGRIALDAAAVAPEVPVALIVGGAAELYPGIAMADALACDGAGIAAYA